MANGISRLSAEARILIKELKIAVWKKTGKNVSEKAIGSLIIVEGGKSKEIVEKIFRLADPGPSKKE